MPREFSVLACALRILLAATIFIALVIFWMLATDFMRCLTAFRVGRGAGRQQGVCRLLTTAGDPPLQRSNS